MTAALDPLTKECKHCGEVKPASEFYRAATNRDGLKTRCRSCEVAYVKAKAQRRRDLMGEEAWAAHQRAIQAKARSNPKARQRAAAASGARAAALERLAQMYPRAFAQFHREERSLRGLPPGPNRLPEPTN